MEQALKLIKEHGVSAVLAFGLLWMNSRITTVEDKLFNCYEARITERLYSKEHKDITEVTRPLAVLVTEPKIKRKRA